MRCFGSIVLVLLAFSVIPTFAGFATSIKTGFQSVSYGNGWKKTMTTSKPPKPSRSTGLVIAQHQPTISSKDELQRQTVWNEEQKYQNAMSKYRSQNAQYQTEKNEQRSANIAKVQAERKATWNAMVSKVTAPKLPNFLRGKSRTSDPDPGTRPLLPKTEPE